MGEKMTEINPPPGDQIQLMGRLRPVVAIVGRPNVGKSTLFNRILGTRWAITDDQPGVTRDQIFAEAEWAGRTFTVVDTGGYVPGSKDAIEVAVRSQAETAIAEADICLFLCDGTTGVTDLDREVGSMLRKGGRTTLLVVNKVDGVGTTQLLDEFYGLGLGEAIPVSAATGRRSGNLLDALVDLFEDAASYAEDQPEDEVKVVLVGRPNVGKSTLINRLAGYQVSIVHDQPGTTRDTTQLRLAWKDTQIQLMDTAGMRRRSKIDDDVEFYSGRRASNSIDRADVAVVLLDGSEGWVMQDARIMEQVLEAGCGLVVAVNKWDLVEGMGVEECRQEIRRRYPFLRDYPVLCMSGLTGRRVQKCLEVVSEVGIKRQTRIPTARLNQIIQQLSAEYPTTHEGRSIRLLYATQYSTKPPAFTIFTNLPQEVPSNYRRHIENRLRSEFDFEGTPLRIVWRKRNGDTGAGT